MLAALASPGRAAPFVAVPGGAFSFVFDADGRHAYAGGQSGVVKVDLTTQRTVRQYVLADTDAVGTFDEGRRELAIHGAYQAGMLDVESGTQRVLITGSAIFGAVTAGPRLYAPSWNDRTLWAAPVDGSEMQHPVELYPNRLPADRGAPCGVAVSPNGAHLLVGDFSSKAAYVVRTSDDTLERTITLGFSACLVAFVDDTTAVAVSGGWPETESDGSASLIDLAVTPPRVTAIRHPQRRVRAIAVADANRLLLLTTGRVDPDRPAESDANRYALFVVPLTRKAPTRRIALETRHGNPYGVAVTPGGGAFLVGTGGGVRFLASGRR